MAEPQWEHFHHQADVGIRGVGRTMPEAFEQAAVGLVAVVCNPANVAERTRVEISCYCDDREILFVDWLNAVIYEMATRRMLFSRFDVVINGAQLTAAAYGEALDAERHEPVVEVKAATYTALEVACRRDGLWVAQCVVDV
jgi:tRNA nucleotidyltransferase (CCA-adding enzyme)